MKRRLIAVLCAAVLVLGMMTGCSGSAKSFSKAGMTITLSDAFMESDMESMTAYYESRTSAVTVLKEDFSTIESVGLSTDMSLQEYAQLVVEGNGLDCQVSEEDGLVYFLYEDTVDGTDFSYWATVYRSSDAYWLVHFLCESKNYEKLLPDFKTWAKSVKFD